MHFDWQKSSAGFWEMATLACFLVVVAITRVGVWGLTLLPPLLLVLRYEFALIGRNQHVDLSVVTSWWCLAHYVVIGMGGRRMIIRRGEVTAGNFAHLRRELLARSHSGGL